MKIFKFLSIACLFLGMSACDDDEMSVTPAISFKEKAVAVAENAKTLKVPLALTSASNGQTIVYVAIKEGSVTGGKEGSLYCSVPTYVVLEKGAVRGFVDLEIIDNDYPNADCSFDLEIIKVEGNALLNATGSVCRVTITDDDSKQEVTVGFDTIHFTANEDAGYTEIPVTVKGLLSGFLDFTVEAIDGTAVSAEPNWDYKLMTSNVRIREEENWGVVNIVLNDAQATKEDRSFKLRITGVKGVDDADTTVGVRENVRECEVVIRKVVREATFGSASLVVNETMKPFDFSVKLTAPVDRDVTITFQPKAGATAIEGVHFKLGAHQLTIKKGESTASTLMTIIDEPYGNYDRVCDFEITEITGNVEVAKDALCRLVIENDDSSVGFGETVVAADKGATLRIPVKLNGLHDKRVQIDLVGEIAGDVNELDYFMIGGKKLVINEGDSIAYVEVQVMRPDVDHFNFNVKIAKLTADGLGVVIPLEANASVCTIKVLPSMIATASSEESDNKVANIIDGNLGTIWHSQWRPENAPLPHWLQVDMGFTYMVSDIEIWRRTAASNNDLKTITLQIGMDGINWEDVETFEFTKNEDDKYRKATLPTPKKAKYVRCYITESHRQVFAQLAEIKMTKIPVFD